MTTKDLRYRLDIVPTSMAGHYKVTIKYRGKEYSCISTNSIAYDVLSWHDGTEMTERSALLSLFDECKRYNKLGEYKNI